MKIDRVWPAGSARWSLFALFVFCFYAATLSAETGEGILARPDVKAAMRAIEANEPHFIEEQIHLCEIAAPSFHEEKRATEMARLFREAGLQNVRIDHAGNVLGDRPGAEPHPRLVVAAHLDTVFPPGTDVHVKREGNILKGPGIGDDCRGLAVLMAVIHAMKDAHLRTRGSLTFAAVTGEEEGSLHGTWELFNTTMKGEIDDFITIEPGVSTQYINTAVGINRYRVTFSGLGGHGYDGFGVANPVSAAGRAIAHISDVQVPRQPRTTFNVGRIGGGVAVNAIPSEAWFEFEVRSSDAGLLSSLDAKCQAAIQAGLDEENARWQNKGKLSVKIEKFSALPTGHTDDDAPLVRAAVASVEALHLGKPSHDAGAASDASVPMHLGIPAILIGGGGREMGAHSLGEAYDVENSYQGVQRALLIILSVLGL